MLLIGSLIFNYIIEMIHQPYVKLRLSSVCKSADKHWKTKPVKGGNKAPGSSFSEEFNLYVNNGNCRLHDL